METINTNECGTHLFRVSVWCGIGYTLDTFNTYAFNEEEALEYVLSYVERNDMFGLYATEDYIAHKLYLTDEERDEMFIYVDPTLTDYKAFPAYLYSENLRIEKVA